MLHTLNNHYPCIYLREPKVDIGYSISWLLSENMQFILVKTCFMKKKKPGSIGSTVGEPAHYRCDQTLWFQGNVQ